MVDKGGLAVELVAMEKNKSLRELNWWKVGGEAEYFAAPKTVEELQSVWADAHSKKMPVTIISGGSNVLVQEGTIKGLVLSLHDLKGVESAQVVEANGHETVKSETTSQRYQVTCLAGTPKADVARLFMQQKLWPAVFLTGIPGDIGGGVVMNAGVGEMIKPREFCEFVDWIEVLRPTAPGDNNNSADFTIDRISAKQIQWEYRHSSKWQPGVIVRVCMSWPLEADPAVYEQVRHATRKRVSTQPLNQPSGGSTFRNPSGLKAAKLIDECGLKGFKIGGAEVSTKHANFLVNVGGATANDIHQLICHVRDTVKQQKGVELQAEVVYLGQWK